DVAQTRGVVGRGVVVLEGEVGGRAIDVRAYVERRTAARLCDLVEEAFDHEAEHIVRGRAPRTGRHTGLQFRVARSAVGYSHRLHVHLNLLLERRIVG